MKYLFDTYKINLFSFVDDLFIYNKKWTDEFCTALKDSKMDVRFMITSRANMITEEMVTKLKSVGCLGVGVGYESGSQRMLDLMKKHIKVEDNYNAYNLLKKYNLLLGVPTIVGMPGETRESIMETLTFIDELKIDSAANYYATPYPNSEIYQYALKEGLIQDEEKYLEWISNSDASEFKINLTNLSETELKYYIWLLRDACRKNNILNGLEKHNIGRIALYKFLIKHFSISILYRVGLFNIMWHFNNRMESKKRKEYKI